MLHTPEDDERSLAELLSDAAAHLFPTIDPPPAIDIEASDAGGDTALHLYLWRGDEAAARTLVRHGANVNRQGDMGETPLHVAVRTAGVQTLAMLIAADARTDIRSEFGQTPRELASDTGRHAVLDEAMALAAGWVLARAPSRAGRPHRRPTRR